MNTTLNSFIRPIDRAISNLRDMGKIVKLTGPNQWQVQCPAHDDNRPSLSLREGNDGKLLLHCHAGCKYESMMDAIGIKKSEEYMDIPQKNNFVASYSYFDGNGILLYKIHRTADKQFFSQTPDGKFGFNGSRRVLYRLPELLESIGQVFLVEGEKDVDRVLALGLIATTNPGGSNAWRKEYAESLRGRNVVILPDNDDAGRKWCGVVKLSLKDVAASVKVVELPDLPDKGDVSDWLNNSGSREELVKLAEQQSEVLDALETITESEWELPSPLGRFNLPKFPLEAFPEQLCALCEFCAAVAESYQVPVDLPAMLVLSVGGASLAKRVVVHVRGDHWEPVNLFTVIALPPANRKSGVFRAVTEPLAHFERTEAERLATIIEQNRNQRIILEESLKHAQKQAAKAKKAEDIEDYKEQASKLVEELNSLEILKSPQYMGDDATPESVALLLKDNGGRLALLSPEGDVFELMAGRYNSGTPNIGVYLKGHAGDDIRVNRVNLDHQAKFINKPALSIGVAVQPDVLRGLTLKRGWRGRGLLGRFLYSLPPSLLGHRNINPGPVEPNVSTAYHGKILDALRLEPNIDETGDPYPHTVTVGSDALKEIDRFALEVEKQLAPGGDFASMGDWAGKLVGAVCRIAGIFHGLIYAASGNPAKAQIDAETMLGAIAIGEYLIPHATAAFFEMGADPEIDFARRILEWVSSEQISEFSKRDAFNSLRGGIQKVNEIDKPLEILVNHGYIREVLQEHKGPGRKPSQKYKINPLWLAHNTHNTHNNPTDLNSAYYAQFAQEVAL